MSKLEMTELEFQIVEMVVNGKTEPAIIIRGFPSIEVAHLFFDDVIRNNPALSKTKPPSLERN